MECKKVLPKLPDFATRPSRLAIGLRLHLSRCSSCRAELQRERELLASLRAWRDIRLPSRLVNKQPSWPRYAGMLATASLVVAIGVVCLRPSPAEANPLTKLDRSRSAHLLVYSPVGPHGNTVVTAQLWYKDGKLRIEQGGQEPRIRPSKGAVADVAARLVGNAVAAEPHQVVLRPISDEEAHGEVFSVGTEDSRLSGRLVMRLDEPIPDSLFEPEVASVDEIRTDGELMFRAALTALGMPQPPMARSEVVKLPPVYELKSDAEAAFLMQIDEAQLEAFHRLKIETDAKAAALKTMRTGFLARGNEINREWRAGLEQIFGESSGEYTVYWRLEETYERIQTSICEKLELSASQWSEIASLETWRRQQMQDVEAAWGGRDSKRLARLLCELKDEHRSRLTEILASGQLRLFDKLWDRVLRRGAR